MRAQVQTAPLLRAAPALHVVALLLVFHGHFAAALDGQHDEQILSVADHHACVIEHTASSDTAGAIVCWGENDEAELEAPQGLFVQVSTAAHHGCALTEMGQLQCWGGDAATGALNCPHPPDTVFTQVTVAEAHACAVTQAGSVTCWGRNTHGESVPPSLTFSTISCGGRQCCGITTSGDLACWGSRLGRMDKPPAGSFTAVSVSSAGHACAIDVFSRLHCWGSIIGGKGGVKVWEGTYVAVSAGNTVTCAVQGDGALFCFGEVSRVWPKGMPRSDVPYSDVAAGGAAVCAIRATDAIVQCWGPKPEVLAVPEDLVPLGYAELAPAEGGELYGDGEGEGEVELDL